MKNVVLVRRTSTVVEVSPVELVYGDIVEVKAGDMIPADIRIIKSDGFKVKANTYISNHTVYHHLNHRWTSQV